MISFKDISLKIGEKKFFSDQANISTNVASERIDFLAYENVSTIQIPKINGEISSSLFLNSELLDTIINLTGLNSTGFNIGGIGINNSGFLTNFSFTLEPMTLTTSDIQINFYKDLDQKNIIQENEDEDVDFKNLFAHGKNSSFSGIGNNLTSAQFSIQQNFRPLYRIGEKSAYAVDFEGGEINCNINGFGLQDFIEYCEESKNINFTLRSMCDSGIKDIKISGMKIISSNINIDSSNNLIGEVSLIKYI